MSESPSLNGTNGRRRVRLAEFQVGENEIDVTPRIVEGLRESDANRRRHGPAT